MQDSKSTDKLMALTMVMDKAINKLSKEKVDKIKTLEITWVVHDKGKYKSDHPLPELKLSFHP